MSVQQKETKKKSYSADWLVQGVLTKLGDTFDRLTGRGWNPSSSLATSKLTEKLKALLDSEIRDLGKEGRFVPHNLKLMIQWDKFSTDADGDLEKLEHELHAAAIDHINDRRYHTYAPFEIEIKTDYFTEGVRLLGSFGKFAEDEEDEAAINVTLPNLRRDDLITDGKISVLLNEEEAVRNLSTFKAKFNASGKQREVELDFTKAKRITVGRSKENGLFIDDKSVSKIHASLVLNSEGQLLVADTGSTNGTFVSGKRIPYGKAIEISEDILTKFGLVEVGFERVGELPPSNVIEPEPVAESSLPTEAVIEVQEKIDDPRLKPTEAFDSSNGDVVLEEAEVEKEKESVVSVSEEPSLFETKDDIEQTDGEESEQPSRSNLDKTQDWEI